jgi:hypothetical protein
MDSSLGWAFNTLTNEKAKKLIMGFEVRYNMSGVHVSK